MDVNDRFCAHLLSSIVDDKHIPFNLSTFVRRRTGFAAELDDPGPPPRRASFVVTRSGGPVDLGPF